MRADVLPSSWSRTKVMAYLSADNELAKRSDPDEEQLALLVQEVYKAEGEALARLAAGEQAALDALLKRNGTEEAQDVGELIDHAAELQKKWQVKRGDIFEVGRHRVMCGDATCKEDVQALMQGERAAMVFTDPPFATMGSSTGKAEIGDFEIIKPFFRELLSRISENLGKGRASFVCCDWRTYPHLYAIAQEILTVNNLVVWYHGALKLGSNFRFCYELIVYALNMRYGTWTEKTSGDGWKIKDRGVTDVWEIRQAEAAPGSHRQHVSQKPVELIVNAIAHCSIVNESVLDFFIGSGTTLVACEQTGRVGRGMEIEPRYVAVTLERLTGLGLEARRVEEGLGTRKPRKKTKATKG